MRTRPTVFGSKSEREVFRALASRWSPRLALYPNLPLANIVELERSDSLSEKQRRLFYATSVDYTFCEPDGRPLLSIEYDGLGEGSSRNGSYTPREAIPPHRKLTMDFKLEAAKTAGYPLAVVSSEETTVLDPDSSIVILDGMVAEFLANRDAGRRAEEMIEEQRKFIDSLPPDELVRRDPGHRHRRRSARRPRQRSPGGGDLAVDVRAGHRQPSGRALLGSA